MANKIGKFSELRVYSGRHNVTHSMKEIKQDFGVCVKATGTV